MSKYTPDTIEWQATSSLELTLLHNKYYQYEDLGEKLYLRFYETEINDDLEPVFVFLNLRTLDTVNCNLEMVCQLTKGVPN